MGAEGEWNKDALIPAAEESVDFWAALQAGEQPDVSPPPPPPQPIRPSRAHPQRVRHFFDWSRPFVVVPCRVVYPAPSASVCMDVWLCLDVWFVRVPAPPLSTDLVGDLPAAIAMVQSGKVSGTTRDGLGRTLLHIAAVVDSAALATAAVNGGAELDAVTVDGSTPLHYAW
jgi:hypothetical protein